MSKNENGFPVAVYNRSAPSDDIAPQKEPAPDGDRQGDIQDSPSQDKKVSPAPAELHSGCGGSGNCLDSMPLAYVYAPNQSFRLLYSAKDSLAHGTLFEELYKPMGVYGNER